MTEATLREQMYRRWKKGEDYFVLAKEMGVTRERMRIILKKMDADVPLVDQIEAQAAEIERLRGDVEKRRETRMSDDDLIRRGDALYAIAGWEIPSTAISALPAVTQPAPDTAADRIEAQAAEIERLRGDLAKAVEALQIARVHVANNAEGWSVSRAPSRDDLTIVDSILSVLTGGKNE